MRCYPDEVSLVAQQASEQVVKTLMSGLALHSLMESMVDHTDMSCSIWRRKPAELPDLFGEEHLQSYQTYLEKSTCRATRPIWRRKHAELPDLFGEEHLQSYHAYLEKKTLRATRPIWRGNPGELLDLQCIWRGNPGELTDLFREENLQSYQVYLEMKTWRTITN